MPGKVKAGVAKGHYCKNKFQIKKGQSELRKKYQQNDGAWERSELFKRKKREMPDAERVSVLQVKLYQKS